MVNKKKDIPLQIHEILEPFVSRKGERYERINDESCLIKFIDSDLNSDFYFTIHQFKENKILISYKPINKNSILKQSEWIESKALEAYFNNWISILEKYDKVNSVFDDPILRSFEEEYFAEFEVLEDDKAKPLNTAQILLLDEHLEELTKGLEKNKDETNKLEIEAIQQDIKFLQENLTRTTKEKVVKSLSKIWAKTTRLGTKFIKEFLTEVKKQFITKGTKFLIEHGSDIIHEITKH